MLQYISHTDDRRIKSKFKVFMHRVLGKNIDIQDLLMGFPWSMSPSGEIEIVAEADE